MLLDACVLIDFIKTDRTVLALIPKHLGPLHVVSRVAAEVKEVDDINELVDLGIEVIKADVKDAFAAVIPSGSTSFQDRLCMLSARRHGFVCVTNDKSLRRLCQDEGVAVVWGLELLGDLCRSGGILPKVAIDIADQMHAINPRHITSDILKRFSDSIRNIRI